MLRCRRLAIRGCSPKSFEQALFDGRVDVCVHSMKDVPTVLPEGLVLAGCLARADARDVLVASPGTTFATLPAGARVGTGALRRLSQLRAVRDDLDYVEVRGNLDTRIAKVHEGVLDAIVLAAAGVQRMGWGYEVAETFSSDEAVRGCRARSHRSRNSFGRRNGRRVLVHLCAMNHARVAAERHIMSALDGGCQVPIGAYARFEGDEIVIDAFVGKLDGSLMLRSSIRTPWLNLSTSRVSKELLSRHVHLLSRLSSSLRLGAHTPYLMKCALRAIRGDRRDGCSNFAWSGGCSCGSGAGRPESFYPCRC